MQLLPNVSVYAARHQMWRPDTRVVAAVSGGSDSVALLFLLHELHTRGECILDAVAHLNHQIRPEADADEEFCRRLATRLDVPYLSASIDVPARAIVEQRSIEVTARDARRAFLTRVVNERGADRVATAHTEDDQAETVLLRLVRGTGVRGLGGIAPIRDRRIRPLLGVCRIELQEYLRGLGEGWREDATNADLRNPRNRVRHELLPYLRQHFNPSVQHAIARLADLARAEDEWIAEAALTVSDRVVQLSADKATLNRAGLVALPDAIARRLVQHALEFVNGGVSSRLGDIEGIRDIAAGLRSPGEISGVTVEHSRTSVVLIKKGPAAIPPAAFRHELTIPGAVHLSDKGWVLEARGPQPRPTGSAPVASNDVVEVDADAVGRGLVVRTRQPGDRVRPMGLGGRKKLQDVFVDRKVSRTDRDAVPIVTDASGRIIWVVGHVLAEEFRVTEHTKAVIILELRRI